MNMNFEGCRRSAGSSSSNFLCGRHPSLNLNKRDAFVPSVPTRDPTREDVTALLTKEMNELSAEDREQVYHDVHCVSEVKDEDPTMVAKCLVQLEVELVKICTDTAYEQAAQQSPNFVQDIKFRLMFLRAESFHPQKAAYRMIRFMEEKLTLFGLDKLTKRIEIDDLHPEDIIMLETGAMMPVTGMDRAQRPVVFGVPHLKPKNCSVESLVRAHFFQMMTSVEDDDDAQKKGFVVVIYLVNQSGGIFNDRREVWDMTRLRNACPVKLICTHLCYNHPTIHSFLSLMMSIMGPQNRIRLREHYGTHIECHYTLRRFGIPQQAIPVALNGEVNTKICRDWVESFRRKATTARETDSNMLISIPAQLPHQEQQMLHSTWGTSSADMTPGSRINAPQMFQISNVSAIFPPRTPFAPPSSSSSRVAYSSPSASNVTLRDNDVIVGKGRGIQEHPGNVRFRRIIEMQMEKYDSSSKFAKTIMVEHIIQSIKESSGRFLRQMSNNSQGFSWEEVDDATVHLKVSCTFRARRRLNKKK